MSTLTHFKAAGAKEPFRVGSRDTLGWAVLYCRHVINEGAPKPGKQVSPRPQRRLPVLIDLINSCNETTS